MEWNGITFFVAEYMNPNHRNVLQSLTKEAREGLAEEENLAEEKIGELVILSEARAVLTGWQDMEDFVFDDEGNPELDENGNPRVVEIEFSEEKAVSILRDPEYQELRTAIHRKARRAADYRKQFLEDAKGN